MKYIIRNTDPECKFWEEELEEAKKWMLGGIPDQDYIEEIEQAASLEELAEAWNRYTDLLWDGSSFLIREVN